MKTALTVSLASILAAGMLAGCVEKKQADTPILTFDIINSQSEIIGKARIAENLSGGVSLVVDAKNISEGEHGIHFHVHADCTAPDFKSAGGHINPMNMSHGLKNPDGPDNADMTNLVADELGNVSYATVNDRVSINGEGGLPALLDEDGSALVIHQNPDDQMTQPIGGAGPRIACAQISKKE